MNQPILQMDLRLLGLSVLVLGTAIGVIWWFGRRVREVLGPPRADGVRDALAANPSIPPQVVKKLQERGLATPAQLAMMSDMERQLLFATMAATIDKEVEPDTAERSVSARGFLRPEDVPTLFCPTCGYRIERFSSTPPITGQCETCRARVVVRRDGARLLLTVIPKDEAEARRPDLRLEP